LYHSIEKMKQLPDDTLVYPAHGAGSLCGKNLSDETVSTIGEQKKYNYALQPMGKQAFMKLVEADQPDAPDYFVYDASKNRQERPNLEDAMREAVKALSLDEVLRMHTENVQIVDVRDGVDFEGSHLKGAVGIALNGEYATWCGSLLNHDDPIVVICETGDQEEAVMRLGRIGFDNVVGFLRGGMSALEDWPDLVEVTSRITAAAAAAAAEQLNSDESPIVLDVRSAAERDNVGFIDGSVNIPLNHLENRLAEIPDSSPLIVHCEGGYRSAIACSLLQKHGIDCADMVGGFKAWLASKLPVVENATA
jgi:hydroxyacylglutathione hydrolase